MLHRAQWHGSPSGLALDALSATPPDKSGKKLQCHSPESRHHSAWLRTWQELKTQSPAKSLIAIYLASLSGTGTVDRWLGQLRRVDSDRSSLDSRESQAFLKLLVQDEKGRRRDALHPTKMLTDDAPRLPAGGAGVSHPISAFGLRSQKVFLKLFGERRGHARNILALGPGEVAKKRILAERPRLCGARKATSDSNRMYVIFDVIGSIFDVIGAHKMEEKQSLNCLF